MTDAHETAPDDVTPDPDPVASMLAVLDLSQSDARTTEDIFTGVSQSMPLGRVYGGQVLAQSIVAARADDPGRRGPCTRCTATSSAPATPRRAITFAVDRIHDGRSFSTRRTQAFQEGVPIFSMIASFQDEDPGIEHQSRCPPACPTRRICPTSRTTSPDCTRCRKRLFIDRPVDLRHVPSPIYLSRRRRARAAPGGVDAGAAARSPTTRRIHRAALAYLSDLTIQESILRAHGVAWATPGLKVASLDHAMWWHRPGRVDEWMLYVQESPSARGGRGLATGRIYSRDGDAGRQRRPGDHGAGSRRRRARRS